MQTFPVAYAASLGAICRAADQGSRFPFSFFPRWTSVVLALSRANILPCVGPDKGRYNLGTLKIIVNRVVS